MTVRLGPSSEQKGNRIPGAWEDDLNYCLDVLKINKFDDKTGKKINELYDQNMFIFGTYHKRLVALKIVADFITLTSSILSQSQLYDFLMLSTTAVVSAEQMRGNKMLLGTTANDIVFKIYRDLTENYKNASDILKVNYPRIIVDVVAILNNGIDTSGKQISLYRVYDYYHSRKSEPISSMTGVGKSYIILDEDKVRTEHNINNNDLIQSLVRITGRNSKEIKESLMRLNNSDIERIRNLSVNYPKIDKYCRLVASDRKHFIYEIERGRGGKCLTKSQLQIAVVSIKKVHKYIENVLDRNFVPHGSHSINHTKHNLEYGYQVMGLMESSRRGQKKEGSNSRS